MSLKTIRMISVLALAKRRFMVSTVLGLATLLLASNTSQAQSYFLGYYYPDEKIFHSDHNSTEVVSRSYGVPIFLQDRYGDQDRNGVVARTVLSQPAAAAPAASPATIHVVVPNAQAKVWFEKYATTSTGTSRDFVTPAIAPGSNFTYHIRVAWNDAGRELSLEREVSVAAGQTASLDFTKP